MAGLKKRWLNKKHDTSEIGVRPPFPKVVKLDICNTCNYKCVFCPQAVRDYTTGCIDFGLGKKIIQECYENGAREICLAMRGEPLLNPHLVDYVKYAKDLGYSYIFTNSNGLLLTPGIAENLLDAGLDSIKISFNAPRDNYELIHGINAYDIVKNHIIQFDRLRKRKNKPCKLYISFVSISQTRNMAASVIEELIPYIDEYVIMKANSRGGGVDMLDEDIFGGEDEYTFSYPCSQPFNTINITAEGYMITCCQDFENLTVVGDVNHDSVANIWNGKYFCDFRDKYIKMDLKGSLCINCLFNKNEKVIPILSNCVSYAVNEKKKLRLIKRISVLKDYK